MFTGSADELRAQKRRAKELAEQVAALLTELQELGPVIAAQGCITALSCTIRPRGNRWTVED